MILWEVYQRSQLENLIDLPSPIEEIRFGLANRRLLPLTAHGVCVQKWLELGVFSSGRSCSIFSLSKERPQLPIEYNLIIEIGRQLIKELELLINCIVGRWIGTIAAYTRYECLIQLTRLGHSIRWWWYLCGTKRAHSFGRLYYPMIKMEISIV